MGQGSICSECAQGLAWVEALPRREHALRRSPQPRSPWVVDRKFDRKFIFLTGIIICTFLGSTEGISQPTTSWGFCPLKWPLSPIRVGRFKSTKLDYISIDQLHSIAQSILFTLESWSSQMEMRRCPCSRTSSALLSTSVYDSVKSAWIAMLCSFWITLISYLNWSLKQNSANSGRKIRDCEPRVGSVSLSGWWSPGLW